MTLTLRVFSLEFAASSLSCPTAAGRPPGRHQCVAVHNYTPCTHTNAHTLAHSPRTPSWTPPRRYCLMASDTPFIHSHNTRNTQTHTQMQPKDAHLDATQAMLFDAAEEDEEEDEVRGAQGALRLLLLPLHVLSALARKQQRRHTDKTAAHTALLVCAHPQSRAWCDCV